MKLIDELPAPSPPPRLRGVVERELRGGRRREVCAGYSFQHPLAIHQAGSCTVCKLGGGTVRSS